MHCIGFAKLKKIETKIDNYGSVFFVGKSSQNSPILALVFGVVFHVYFVCIEVVSHYDLSVLSMSAMGFQK